ncbi:hypothetical protein M432DRAFT_133022 [Thermoascus aurantiacus ATCC 26904]
MCCDIDRSGRVGYGRCHTCFPLPHGTPTRPPPPLNALVIKSRPVPLARPLLSISSSLCQQLPRPLVRRECAPLFPHRLPCRDRRVAVPSALTSRDIKSLHTPLSPPYTPRSRPSLGRPDRFVCSRALVRVQSHALRNRLSGLWSPQRRQLITALGALVLLSRQIVSPRRLRNTLNNIPPPAADDPRVPVLRRAVCLPLPLAVVRFSPKHPAAA